MQVTLYGIWLLESEHWWMPRWCPTFFLTTDLQDASLKARTFSELAEARKFAVVEVPKPPPSSEKERA